MFFPIATIRKRIGHSSGMCWSFARWMPGMAGSSASCLQQKPLCIPKMDAAASRRFSRLPGEGRLRSPKPSSGACFRCAHPACNDAPCGGVRRIPGPPAGLTPLGRRRSKLSINQYLPPIEAAPSQSPKRKYHSCGRFSGSLPPAAVEVEQEMKTKRLAAMFVMAGAGLCAGQDASAQKATVIVCMDPAPQVLMGVRPTASAMFVSIGVRIDWRERDYCPVGVGAIQVHLLHNAGGDRTSNRDALAFSRPYEGTIVVF